MDYLTALENKKIDEIYTRTILNEKTKHASIWGAGVAIGISDDGVYALEMTTGRGYFSMSANTLAPVTEEMLEEWERDTIEYEAEYYYTDVFALGDEDDWEEMSGSQQKEAIEQMVSDMVTSKIDNMSGSFDWEWKSKDDEYYLDMISAGQDEFKSLKYPLINKKDLDVLDKAWQDLHLKDIKDIPDVGRELMNKATKIYKGLEKNKEKLLEKSIQFYMLKAKGKDKLFKKIMQKKGYKLGKK